MKQVQHHSSNDILGRPQGSTADECDDLHITRTQVAYGAERVPAIVSFWQPSPEQLQLLNEHKPVRLVVLGRTHAPLSVGVDGDGGAPC